MTKVCPKCGLTNPGEAAFCHNCASQLGPVAVPTNRPSWPQDQAGGPVIGGAGGGPAMGGQAYVAAAPESQKAMISMILAIAGFLCCGPILGIPAAILGWMELDAIKNGRAPAGNKMMATIGLWGGIVATLGHIIFYVIWFFLGLISSASAY